MISINKDDYTLPYPFENLSVKQIIELADRTSIHEIKCEDFYYITVNGQIVTDDNNNDYISLLIYIKYLNDQIDKYFKKKHPVTIIHTERTDLYSYLKNIIYKINNCVELCIKLKRRPYPIDIINYIDQYSRIEDNYIIELYSIIEFVLKLHGYQINKNPNIDNEIIETEQTRTDYSALATDLLKILEIDDDEVEARYEEANHNHSFDKVNLQSWLLEKKLKLNVKNYQR